MKLTLINGTYESAIAVNDQVQVTYGRKIHHYESKSDFDTIKTEMLTYGDKAAWDVINYLKGVRK